MSKKGVRLKRKISASGKKIKLSLGRRELIE